jgi:DNA-binding NtrC family response regulator
VAAGVAFHTATADLLKISRSRQIEVQKKLGNVQFTPLIMGIHDMRENHGSSSEQLALDIGGATPPQGLQILIVTARCEISRILRDEASQETTCELAETGAGAVCRIHEQQFEIVVIDRTLPDLDGKELLHMIMNGFPALSILTFDSANLEGGLQVVRALHGEVDHNFRKLQTLLVQYTQRQNLGVLNAAAPSGPASRSVHIKTAQASAATSELLPSVIGGSAPMALVGRLVKLVAARNTTVLLTGETGTGKEKIARAVHALSPRHRNPFVVVNCGAIPETLFEAELFGYERGAFTGAQQSRIGKIQAARGGTLFLDEVGELPLGMQAKLLRFLQEREVQRLGSTESARVDVRVVAATNADLKKMVAAGTFRGDLYYRLNVFPIAVPPLRQRRDDIAVLAQHFLSKLCRESCSPPKHLSAQAMSALKAHDWPGNVRELEHVMERSFIFAESNTEIHCGLGGGEGLPDLTVESSANSHLRLPPTQSLQIDAGMAKAVSPSRIAQSSR